MIDFNKLQWGQIDILNSILSSTTRRNTRFVQSKYESESVNYKETLQLLIEMGLVEVSNNELRLSNNYSKVLKQDGSSLRTFFIKTLFHERSDIVKYFGDFFDNFELLDNLYRFIPSNQDRLKYSGIRNFLISLGVLHYDPAFNGYTTTRELVNYLLIKERILSYNEFLKRIKAEEEIGIEAEKLIYDKEISRFRNIPNLKKKIIHMSKVNVRAGYDIRSFEKKGKNKWTTKYIEVKAVSEYDWKFYWSKNEINKAKHFGKRYYLFLVPVIERNVLCLTKLKKIKDPYRSVFQNNKDWLREIVNTAFYINK